MNKERWQPVVGYEGLYEVSDLGRIRNIFRPLSIRKPTRNANGYWIMCLHKNGHRKTHLVHRLVLKSFVGPPPNGCESAHGDGNRQNCALANLRWATPQENYADRRGHGTDNAGEKNGRAKLTPPQVKAIRDEYSSGNITHKELARKHRVAPSNIHNIVKRIAWKGLP